MMYGELMPSAWKSHFSRPLNFPASIVKWHISKGSAIHEEGITASLLTGNTATGNVERSSRREYALHRFIDYIARLRDDR